MQPFTEQLEVLYVSETDETPPAGDRLGDSVAVSSVAPDRAAEAVQSAACVLISDTVETARACRLVRTVRAFYPSLPIVAFTEDDSLERLLDAGVTDVIRSQAAETPPAVIRRRIQTVLASEHPGEIGTYPRPQDWGDNLFREVTENIEDVVWVNTPGEKGQEYVNSAYEEVWGWPRERLYEDREALLETIHPDDRECVRRAMETQYDRPEAYDVSYRIVRPDGETRWIHSRAFGVYEGGELERIVGVATDITEQKARERRLEAQRDELAKLDHLNRVIRSVDEALLGAQSRREMLQAVCDRVAAVDRYQFAVALSCSGSRLQPTAWTEGAKQVVDDAFAVGIESIVEAPGWQALESGQTVVMESIEASVTDAYQCDEGDGGVCAMAAVPVIYGQTDYGVVAVCSSRPDVFGNREQAVLTELGETLGHAIAALESRERERTLTSLHRATDELLTADTPAEVGDIVVAAASEVLELSGLGIYLFDEETNLLSPVASTETFREFFGGSPVFGPGKDDSITWHTYLSGEPQCFDDVHESDRLANPDTPARSAFFVPLGTHGVFVALSTTVGGFDEQRRRLVALLAATTEAALDRVTKQVEIHERDAELAVRAERLTHYERAISVFRGLTRLLRQAETRDELEAHICEQLVERECVSFAWIGCVPPEEDRLEPRTWAGTEAGYLDVIELDTESTEPAVRAEATGEAVSVPNVTTALHDEPWAREAIDREYQSVLAIPLVGQETGYGVLGVYAAEPDAFGGLEDELAAEIGSTIAFGVSSIETRRAVLGEQATELDLRIDGGEPFLSAVARIADEPISCREVIPMGGQTTGMLFALADAPVDAVLALESEFVAVESLSHTEQGERDLFRAILSGPTVAATVLDCGGVPHRVTATPSELQATVRLPRELGVRAFLDRFRERYPETTLRSRRDVDRVAATVDDARPALDDRLTDRQREVLVTAYRSGFFTSPRETTGEELAALLDLSQPTVTQHLREAQRRLFEALFEHA